ncbi:MAG: quinolinate synthase NadA [Capsulimonadaceae bacterium]|nr:quinolinate synthase NadA [Capsulimonadaceae bacterium]
MFQPPLPPEYSRLSDVEAVDRIQAAKRTLGERVVILGHHYQRDETIRHADFRGDSYKLAKDGAAQEKAEFIVFCGVHFMAESADILSGGRQKVILPNLSAGCSMADMASIHQVRACWRALERLGVGSDVVPVTYINSAASLKSFVGEHGGAVCTSSNCAKVLKWALAQGEKILFFPDQHLGRNTALAMGFDESQMVIWDPLATEENGGETAERLRDAKFILWKGHCSVHGRFNVRQIEYARERYPDVRVIVHPECRREVVEAADDSGSTEKIQRVVRDAPNGSKWAVGTEINLVNRLAHEEKANDKLVFCLDPIVCPCSTMYRIAPANLLWVLESLVRGEIVNQITVPPDVASNALLALDRMLTIAG